MFVYCLDALHLSEAEAYLRLTAARAAREHPVLLQMLADGRLHLTGIAKLAPHLTPQNRDLLLSRAVHRSKRQIEELVAELAPRPAVPGVLRKLPSRPTPSSGTCSSSWVLGRRTPRLVARGRSSSSWRQRAAAPRSRSRPFATSSVISQNEITETASSLASIAASAKPRADRPMRVSA